MCNSVHSKGRIYSTPRELAELVGGARNLVWQKKNPFVPWPEEKDWRQMDLCLCPVNLEATLSGAGLRWRRGDDPMEFFVEE
jgi:hypothetical protein